MMLMHELYPKYIPSQVPFFRFWIKSQGSTKMERADQGVSRRETFFFGDKYLFESGYK